MRAVDGKQEINLEWPNPCDNAMNSGASNQSMTTTIEKALFLALKKFIII